MSDIPDPLGDLAALEEQINELRALDEALEDRMRALEGMVDRDPLARYEPSMPNEVRFGGCQWDFHASVAKERVIWGGNRSGKTECAIVEHIFHISGKYPDGYPEEGKIRGDELRDRHGLRSRIYAPDYEHSIAEVIVPKIMRWLPHDLRVEPQRDTSNKVIGFTFPNGWDLSLMTHGQRVIQSAGYDGDIIQFDEPPASEKLYFEAIGRTIDRGGRIWTAATPTEITDDWFVESLVDKGTSDPNEKYLPFVVNLDIRDNKHLPPAEVGWWVQRLPDHLRSTRVEGMPMSDRLRVYRSFLDKQAHILPPDTVLPRLPDGRPDGWKLAMAVDPHDAKPPAMLWWAYFDPAKFGGNAPIWMVAESWDPTLTTIAAAAARIRDIEMGLGVRASIRVLDPNKGETKSASTGRTTKHEYREAGKAIGYELNFRYPQTDSLSYGHEAVRKLLCGRDSEGGAKIRVLPSLTHTWSSLAHYRYKDELKKIIMDNDHKHFADDCRYLALVPSPWGITGMVDTLKSVANDPVESDPEPVRNIQLYKREMAARNRGL